MMKTILILLLSLLMLSCGSVQKSKTKESEEFKEKSDLQKDESLSAVSQSSENSSVKIENNNYKISVKPIAGQNSFFSFTAPDGQVFKGETNAELNFEKAAEKKEIRTEKKYLTQITYKSQTTYKTHTTYKTVTNNSEKLKVIIKWYLLLIVFLIPYVLKIVWKWIKKSNWYLKLINKL